MIKIKWHGENTPPQEAIDQTVKELEELLEDGLPAPHKLIFHHVFLGSVQDGPIVFVWGDDDDPGVFQCEYMEKVEWNRYDQNAAAVESCGCVFCDLEVEHPDGVECTKRETQH